MPAVLTTTLFYGNTLLQWMIAGGAGVATVAIVMVFRSFLRRRVEVFAARTATLVDDHIADVIGRTRLFFAIAIGVLVSIAFVDLGTVEPVLLRLVLIATLIQVGIWTGAFVRFAIERFAESRNDPAVGGAVGILRVMALFGIWSLVFLLILGSLGIDVTAGVAGLGIGGVAVALAVQSVLGDLFASLSIVFDRPFLVGDFIVVGEDSGTVEQIGLKTTRIRSLSRELLVFSNSDLLKARIRNYRDMTDRRVVFKLGVTYETPRAKIAEIAPLLREIVSKQESVRLDRAHFIGFGDSSLDFEVAYFVLSSDYNRHMDLRQDINLAILEAFEARGIDFAYPTRTLWVKGPTAPVTA